MHSTTAISMPDGAIPRISLLRRMIDTLVTYAAAGAVARRVIPEVEIRARWYSYLYRWERFLRTSSIKASDH